MQKKIACLMGLFFTSQVLATNGMRVIGIGPVQRSMGGVNVALPLDSATTLTNPAGISNLDERLDMGATYFKPSVSYKASSNASMVTQDNQFMDSDMRPAYIPAVGIVKPLTDRLTFGFGAYGVCGMGVHFLSNLYHNVTYTNYQYMKFSPALSYEINDKTSLGVAANFGYATMEFFAGSPAEKPHNDAEAIGFGITVGLLQKISEVWSAGLVYESKQTFTDFRFNTDAGRDKLALNQPQSVGLGLAVRPSQSLRIGFDLVWLNWSQTTGKNLPQYTENHSGATAWNMNWQDQWVYKIGLEYDLSDKHVLRLGYNYARNPLDQSRAFENIAFPAIAEHHFTGGLGLKLTERHTLNLGAMISPVIKVDTANSAQYLDSGQVKMSQYSIDMGVSYVF